MAEEYGIIEEKREQPESPVRSLLRVPHQDAFLIVSRNAFGPNSFKKNVAKMKGSYRYPNTRKVIAFREPTTSESISAIAYDFVKSAKPEILDLCWLQAGRVFNAPEWVVVNPPRDKEGKIITDERALKNFLNNVTKVNGIYRLPNGRLQGVRDCSFVPYESFKQEVQSGEDFARSGLARGLEYSDGEKASKLEVISAKENYPNGVNIFRFNQKNKVMVVGLDSGRSLDVRGLDVVGHWDDSSYGYAFGVLDKSAEGASLEK